jgi:nucleoside-diphosphate-sugar epimerase
VLVADAGVVARAEPFYMGRKVLVTGGMSFIGSHLVEALVATGAEVRVADDLSSGREENVSSVRSHIHFLLGDLREPEFARKACAGVDVVFHLAAAHGGRGYIDTHPVECLGNLALDHTIYLAAAQAGASKIVFASSACVYPTSMQDSHDSRDLLREVDASFDEAGKAFADGEYGWAKLMGEMQLRAFHRQYRIDGIACRIFTAYGERENESHAVIALIAKAAARLDPYPIWGDGLQTRNFTYVGDTVAGLLLSGARLSGFDIINVGTTQHVRINDMVDEIFSLMGWYPNHIFHDLQKPVGVRSRAADVAKAQCVLDWSPMVPLEEGLRRTIDWYLAYSSAERLSSLDAFLMSR